MGFHLVNWMKDIVGGTLLVAGTSIGAGMLALPVVTAAGGFIPAFFVYLLCWLFMTCTGLLFLELCLKLPPDANIITMASTYLGRFGKVFAWALYLFLFYSLSVAYISGGGGLLQDFLGIDLVYCQWIFVLVLGSCVYVGARMVDRLNLALMAGLILTYLAFVIFGLPQVEFSRLEPANWDLALFALPVIFTAFSYQGIIPSLTTYFKRDAKRVRIAIIAGTSVAFFIYLLWEFLILGIIPVEGLLQAKELGQTAVAPLKDHVSASSITTIGQAFAFFAISTSFLGVTLGLFDFLADGLSMPKKGGRKVLLALFTFIPPLMISLVNPSVFIVALVFAGGIGCALLLGLLPALMAWVSRYRNEGHGGPLQLRGGKIVLVLLFLFVLFELIMEIGIDAFQ
ncbi:MAG: tyrosine transporter [Chlamydiae bacterium CG10_big_fil_rev_8_21_14_0_10_42_34]|nr:MAG: tyrosine transporter [Chlamydiae bacterium CG10_big_fil_rev_8_21_14_0_10_42_34]